jgi:sec-independent protein translocase protein TatA
MGRIGPMELALIVGVALLLFGAGRVAELGKGLGESIRNFKKGLRDEAPPELLPAPDKANDQGEQGLKAGSG